MDKRQEHRYLYTWVSILKKVSNSLCLYDDGCFAVLSPIVDKSIIKVDFGGIYISDYQN